MLVQRHLQEQLCRLLTPEVLPWIKGYIRMEEEIGCTVLPCVQLELNEIKMCCALEVEKIYTLPWDCDSFLLSTAVIRPNSDNDRKRFKTEKKVSEVSNKHQAVSLSYSIWEGYSSVNTAGTSTVCTGKGKHCIWWCCKMSRLESYLDVISINYSRFPKRNC